MDPGTTVGLAILDLRGRLLHLSSKKGADDRWVVDVISQYGTPVIVATDVHRPPERVAKLAAAFGARLWFPEKDLAVSYKDSIARRFSYGELRPANDHERDALAAAFAAYSFFSAKFRQVERRLREMDRQDDEDRVKREVIFGQSVDQALRATQKEKKPVQKRKTSPPPSSSVSPECSELKKRLERQEEIIMELRERIKELERELRRARSGREKEIRKDALVARLEREKRALLEKLRARDKRISSLSDECRRLRDVLVRLGKGEYILIPLRDAEVKGMDVVLRVGNYAVVERDEWEQKDPQAFGERLRRMIEEYRRSRVDRI